MPDESKSKAEAAEGIIPDLGKLPIEEPEGGLYEAYSNIVNLNWTLTDVRLRFAELIQVGDNEHPTWENQHGILLERAAITIPWNQAKVWCNMLTGIIQNYEDINGELKPLKLPARPA